MGDEGAAPAGRVFSVVSCLPIQALKGSSTPSSFPCPGKGACYMVFRRPRQRSGGRILRRAARV